MTNENIRDIINTILRKDFKGGFLSIPKFNNLLSVGNYEVFDKEMDKYEMSQEVTDAIYLFKKEATGLSITNDVLSIPDDFARHRFLIYKKDGTEQRKFDIVTDGEWGDRMMSYITIPTESYPIAMYEGGGIKLSPTGLNGNYIIYGYFRFPLTPVFDYYMDANDNIKYLAAGESYTLQANEVGSLGQVSGTVNSLTIEMEWNEDMKLKVMVRILAALGVTMSEQGIYQYAKIIEQES